MKTQLSIIFSLFVIMGMTMSGAASNINNPDPDETYPERGSGGPRIQVTSSDLSGADFDKPWAFRRHPIEEQLFDSVMTPETPLVPTGAPGLTFSHIQTFGEAERAYYDDTQHISYPYGVTTDGTFVWIADSDGNRALKFNANGVYQNFTIGSAGFREYYEDDDVSLEWILDVGVDSGGNIWLVDGGAHHVAKFNSSGVYQYSLGSLWNEGSGNDQFWRPNGIAFDASGNIYISDRNNHRVQIFNGAGTYLTTLGSFGSGNLNLYRPEHIAIYGSKLYVADSRNHRVQIFNITNPLSITYLATLGITGNPGNTNTTLDGPRSVAANASYIFVADSNNNRVQVFNNSSPYSWITTIGGTYGAGSYEFRWPQDVAVDSSGNIYVADNENHRIQKFTSSRIYNLTYGTTGIPYLTDQQHYNAPTGVAVSADGSIYISEGRGRRIVKIKSDGTPLWKIGENGVDGDDINHFSWPEGIAVGQDGRVFVADSENHRIQVFDSSGGFLASIGSYGSGNGQFDYPKGVAMDKNGNLYVADTNNCRIQIFNSSLIHMVSFGSCGTGNNQFLRPRDLAVDSIGRIYVVDGDSHSVKVYDVNRVYLRSIGLTGVSGVAYDRLSNPVAIAIDALDRVYISTSWGSYIKVYDNEGNFLNCLENGWGSFQGIFRQVAGLTVDASGNLYMADELSHQVKRYLPSAYPGWLQVNVTGFGNHYNWGVWSMTAFNNQLFASAANWDAYGAELYRFENGDWTQVMSGGFGESENEGVDVFAEFNGKLYAGTWNQWYDSGADEYRSNGGQIWRSATATNGSWEKVVDGGFGSTNNGEVMSMKAFGNYLYAGTWSWDMSDHGAEIYRSTTGDLGSWTKVFDDAIPSHHAADAIMVMEVFSNNLYAGMSNWSHGGAELWRTSDGTTWSQVNLDGFGDLENRRIISLAESNGKLYAGIQNYDATLPLSNGAQVWRSVDGTTWEKVVDSGFGDPNNWGVGGLIVYHSQLYAIVNNLNFTNNNQTRGMEVWRSSTGDLNDWERVGWHAFGGESESVRHYWNGNFVVYDDLLYIGTTARWLSGGRIWSYLPYSIFLPIVKR